MLTTRWAGTAYANAMAAATARDGALEAPVAALGTKPRRSDLCWRSIICEPGSYVNAAKLRIALARVPWKQIAIAPTDKDLVRALANLGKFDEARQMASVLRTVKAKTGNLLTNGNFSADPSFEIGRAHV